MALDLSRYTATYGSYNPHYVEMSSAHFPLDLSPRKALRQTNGQANHSRVRFADDIEILGEENKKSEMENKKTSASNATWCVRRKQHGILTGKTLAASGPGGVTSEAVAHMLTPDLDHRSEMPNDRLARQHYNGTDENTQEARHHLYQQHHHAAGKQQETDHSSLPVDPRQWTKEHVHLWLQRMRTRHDLRDVTAEGFMMNGKGLCMMNVSMFCHRSPRGGAVLFRDFQRRLNRAVAVGRYRS